MKKFFHIYHVVIILSMLSCSAPKLYQQGIKKIEKAISKDPSIKLPSDTITTITLETRIDTVDNEIVKTIIKTIEIVRDTCEFDYEKLKTNNQLRWERRIAKDSLRHEQKMHRLDNRRFSDSLKYLKTHIKYLTRQVRDTNTKEEKIARYENKCSWILRTLGKLWWVFLIVGIIIGLYGKTWIQRFLPFLFK